jgi:hypothetical protein
MKSLLNDDLDVLLNEYGVTTEAALIEKKTSTTDKVVRAMPLVEMPRRVEVSADQCKKLCEKSGLRYKTGYENRIIERITTTEAADRYGDIVRAKGIDNTNYRKNAVVLFAHDHSAFPVGKSIKEWIDNGIKGWRSWDLYFDDEIDPSGKSDLTFRMVDSGAMPGGSIGFVPGQAKCDHTPEERAQIGLGRYGVEYLTAEKLEHSACSIPANPEALSNCLKSIESNRLKSMFAQNDIDRLVAEKMLDEQLADVFASVLGVTKTYFIPKGGPGSGRYPEGSGDGKGAGKVSAKLAEAKSTLAAVSINPTEENLNIAVSKFASLYDAHGDEMVRLAKEYDPAESNVKEAIGLHNEAKIAAEEVRYHFQRIADATAQGREVTGMDANLARGQKSLELSGTVISASNDLSKKSMSIEEPIAKEAPVMNPINLTVNIDLSEAMQCVSNLNKEIEKINEKSVNLLKSFEDKTAELLAATQRALTAMESRSKSTSLYDRKEIEKALKL